MRRGRGTEMRERREACFRGLLGPRPLGRGEVRRLPVTVVWPDGSRVVVRSEERRAARGWEHKLVRLDHVNQGGAGHASSLHVPIKVDEDPKAWGRRGGDGPGVAHQELGVRSVAPVVIPCGWSGRGSRECGEGAAEVAGMVRAWNAVALKRRPSGALIPLHMHINPTGQPCITLDRAADRGPVLFLEGGRARLNRVGVKGQEQVQIPIPVHIIQVGSHLSSPGQGPCPR